MVSNRQCLPSEKSGLTSAFSCQSTPLALNWVIPAVEASMCIGIRSISVSNMSCHSVGSWMVSSETFRVLLHISEGS
jgi:hypothetical protein